MTNLILLFLAASLGPAPAPPPNWSGQYSSCNRHLDLLKRSHLNLGVRISTSNPVLAGQFERALQFWSGIVDLDWHREDTQECTIQLVDGAPELFDSAGTAARSQFPDRPEFQGWIAFNPHAKMTEHEMFVISVHEIGHLLGLPHNPSGASVMYFFNLEGSPSLDAVDLNELADRHKLRDTAINRVAVP